jgi:hypothetical protein
VKNIILSLLILTSISAKCQNEDADKKSKEILIAELIKNSKSGLTKKLDSGTQIYPGYKICENQNSEIQKLDKLISNKELDELFHSKNGTLKCVAFIIFANRNNEKEILLKKLNEIFEENYLVIVPNCSDVSKTENIYKFCVELVAYPKVYFKPSFKLSDVEKMNLLIKGFKYDDKMQ